MPLRIPGRIAVLAEGPPWPAELTPGPRGGCTPPGEPARKVGRFSVGDAPRTWRERHRHKIRRVTWRRRPPRASRRAAAGPTGAVESALRWPGRFRFEAESPRPG